MAPFYSRYIPVDSVTSANLIDEEPTVLSKKRKPNDELNQPRQNIKKNKKTVRESSEHLNVLNEVVDNGESAGDADESSVSGKNGLGTTFHEVAKPNGLSKEGNSENGKSTSDEPPVRKRKKTHKTERINTAAQEPTSSVTTKELKQNGMKTEDKKTLAPVKEKKKKRKKADDGPKTTGETHEDYNTQQDQHVSIRSKFEKSKKQIVDDLVASDQSPKQKQKDTSPPLELHDLEPLPQPTPVQKKDERPTFSSLPPWLAHPLRVDSAQSLAFGSLGLDPVVLGNLQKQSLEHAFPVQSAVIPLLTDGALRHLGDVCISAATGSGKTLAYVLPMIQHLRRLATTRLRCLIVVPTRELVKQVRETCETSAAGSSIKIATALGSKSLHDEQEALVEKYEIYDTKEYQKQQNAPIDWSKVNLDDMLSESDNDKEAAIGFVTKYRSKVDILICTPGRLVDHIRSTKGFTLDYIQWLVIDEADRLLNESFQEWTEIVIPALQSRAAHALQDDILCQMRLEIPERIIQKVILSATMTQDVSKLNSLRLRNPKLVVVGDRNMPLEVEATEECALEPQLDEGSTFNLPSTLLEYAVPVGDGAEKPLYLLELLRTEVNVFDLEDAKGAKSDSTDQEYDGPSSSDSSASDSESTTSSSTSSLPKTHNPTIRSPPDTTPPSSYTNTALIFTRSTSSATRLHRLLSLLSTPISSLTSTLTKSSSTASSTRKTLANFRNHKIRIIIATDRASRGLDLPGLGHVISYDVPSSVTTYVHRVGRTARAGKEGKAWTLLAHREARWFWGGIGKGGNGGGGIGIGEEGRIVRRGKVRRCNLDIGNGQDDGTRERYERALKTLGEEVVGGGGGSHDAGVKK